MRWLIKFENYYGDTCMFSIAEHRIPKYIEDRAYNGTFGRWLIKKYFGNESTVRWKVIDIVKQD